MTFDPHFAADDAAAIPVLPLDKASFRSWLAEQSVARQDWVDATGFNAEAGSLILLPGADGRLDSVLFGWDKSDFWSWAQLPGKLPPGQFRLAATLTPSQADAAALGWGLANYQFTELKRAKNGAAAKPHLCWPPNANRPLTLRLLAGIALARDLINRPANALGPAELAGAAEKLAAERGASCRVIVGDALLTENYPAIHAVGRAASRAPRLIDLRWGEPDQPKLTLVAKGVCFDSGGLDLKSAANMKIMKKDMGGAAVALGLASAIMDAEMPLRLRVLIPAVENAVSGDAFRPLDVISTRKGLSVEIGNTDAEGRLILCDALTEADSEKPDWLIDLATLTGAARVALGPDLPALFTPDDELAAQLLAAGQRSHDPLWRMPLWGPYRRQLDSKIADLNNANDNPHAGAITAALFLAEFVSPARKWAHIDLFAWNPGARPGRPEGGEAMSLRALYHAIALRFASSTIAANLPVG
jgi:leucyl aminopeptidase